MALKHGVRAVVTTGELYLRHGSSGLYPRLVPEERDQTSHLNKGRYIVINVDCLLCLHKVSHMSIIVDATDIEPEGGETLKTSKGRREGGREGSEYLPCSCSFTAQS